MAIYPNSNLPTASQPWGRAIQAKVELVDAQFLTERTNNAARDAQLQASYTRLDATSILTAAAVVAAQDAIDAITGVTTNIYVPGTTNINGGTIQTGTINASSINAGTMTGFTINTAASGARVQLGGSMVSFWNSSNTMTGIVLSDGSSITMRNTVSGTGWPSGSSSQMVLDAGVSYWQAQSGSFGCTVTLNSNTLAVGGSITATSNITTTGDVRGSYLYSSNTALITGRFYASERILNQGGYDAVVANATNMFIASNGAIARTTTTSSREAKQNIRPLSFNADNFISVSPVLFDYKDGIITEGSGDDITGFIAEDFQDAGFAELITPKESETDYIGLRYDKLYMYLHKVVAMQNERIKLLEGK